MRWGERGGVGAQSAPIAEIAVIARHRKTLPLMNADDTDHRLILKPGYRGLTRMVADQKSQSRKLECLGMNLSNCFGILVEGLGG